MINTYWFFIFLVLIIFHLNTEWQNSIHVEHTKLESKIRMSQFSVIYVINGTMLSVISFLFFDIRSAEYEKPKLSTLPWYCPICAKEMPFSSLSNKEFNIFLSKNPPHPSAQAAHSKNIDKHTKEILKKLKDLNKLFDHTENTVSCE